MKSILKSTHKTQTLKLSPKIVSANEKIERIISSKIDEVKKSSLQPLVMISTGSYCPPHSVHLQNFLVAKEGIKDKYIPLLGLISPSHDRYVKGKLKSSWALPCRMRVEMLDDIIKAQGEDDWLMADPWEGEQPKFVDFPTVFATRGKEVAKMAEDILGREVEVAFIMGADLLIRTWRLPNMLSTGKIIVVSRPGQNLEKVKATQREVGEALIIVEPDGHCNPKTGEPFVTVPMSSTQVREFYEKGQRTELERWTGPKCLEMLDAYFGKKGKDWEY